MSRPIRASTRVALTASSLTVLLMVSYLTGSPQAGNWLRAHFGTTSADPSASATADESADGSSTALAAARTPEPVLSPTPSAPPSAVPSATSSAPAPSRSPLLQNDTVVVNTSGYWSWALLNITTGQLSGSTDPTTVSDTASMVKSWIGADYLRRATERGQTPSSTAFKQLSIMIRDSDNAAASTFHSANGDIASIRRMISLCSLTDTTGTQGSWSLTRMSTRDIVRLGSCIASGRAAGSAWTQWLLNEMRNVRGEGRFGVVQALPASTAAKVAIKNGWLLRESDHLWHVSCLAIGDGWVLGVHARYRNTLGKDYGEQICRSVGEQLM